MNQLLEAGRIVATHGVRGEVKLVPSCDSAEFLKRFESLYIDGTPRTVRSLRVHKEAALISFAGVDTVEAAMTLRGKTVFFDRDAANLEPGQVFLADLYGLPVYDTRTEREIGVLSDVLFLPAGEVWVVHGESGDSLIPMRGGFIDPVESGAERITVHTIEGMLCDEN